MELQEIFVYVIVASSVLSLGWLVMARDGGADGSGLAQEAGWSRMPFLFRLFWGYMVVLEDTLGAALASWMPNRARKLSVLAEISALPLSGARVMAVSAALCVIGCILGAGLTAVVLFFASSAWACIPMTLGLAAIGWFWPGIVLAKYARRRQERLTKELPFAIDLISCAMRSGLEFGAAVRYYTSMKIGGPLDEELGRVLSDVQLAHPIASALSDMARRVRLSSFTSFAGVVSYGMDIGAPISETLRIHGKDLRRERFNLAARKAARAPSIMIVPLVLFIMPAVFIVLLTPMVMRLKGLF